MSKAFNLSNRLGGRATTSLRTRSRSWREAWRLPAAFLQQRRADACRAWVTNCPKNGNSRRTAELPARVRMAPSVRANAEATRLRTGGTTGIFHHRDDEDDDRDDEDTSQPVPTVISPMSWMSSMKHRDRISSRMSLRMVLRPSSARSSVRKT